MASEESPYVPLDAISRTIKTTTIMTTSGLFVSAVRNTLTKENVGAMGVFTRTGGTIALFGAMGGAYEFGRTASANLRERNDSYNEAIGGFLSGSMLGLFRRSLPLTIGYGAMVSVIMSALDYTGGSIVGRGKDPNVDEIDRKEFLRKNWRRPVEETVAELGEGRGIYGPGYEERRRARLKEKYGHDFDGVPSSH